MLWAASGLERSRPAQVAHPFHILRHSFASHFIMAGGNVLSLQKILGHASIEMTLVYAHLAPDFLRASWIGCGSKRCAKADDARPPLIRALIQGADPATYWFARRELPSRCLGWGHRLRKSA